MGIKKPTKQNRKNHQTRNGKKEEAQGDKRQNMVYITATLLYRQLPLDGSGLSHR